MKLAIVFALFAVCAFGQLVEVGIVDDFFIGQNIQKAQVTLANDLSLGGTPIIATSSFSAASDCNIEFGNTLIGCSRDMEMRVTSGEQGRSFDSEIFSINGDANFRGEWVVANPKTSSSIATLQYDGADETFTLNTNGLNNFDLTFGGTATEFRLSIVSDLETQYTTTVYTSSGTCSAVIQVPRTPAQYNYADTFFDIQFSDFSGGCSFSSVGAVELILPSSDAVDAIVRKISILGILPSASPTPTPIPSQSNTPTRPPTNSPTPSQTPTPTPSRSTECTVVCNCPAFSCHLVFNFDDDDFFFYF